MRSRAASPRSWYLVALACTVVVLGGCEAFQRDRLPPEPPPPTAGRLPDAVLAGSVGSVAFYSNADPLILRGFGIVVGLDGTGSSDCPSVVRDYLADFLSKQIGPQAGNTSPNQSPGQLIDSLDTAVVEVMCELPAGALVNTRFDLQVQAVPGTATRSLAGGLLLPTELKVFDRAASGQGIVTGRTMAEAGGPLIVNPFANEVGAGDLRSATVLGGGRCIETRDARLVLVQPNYQTAKIVERRLNERFGQDPDIATAVSRGFLTVKTPRDYADDPAHFRQVAAYIYLANDPTFVDAKRRELRELAAAHDADLDAIGLAWEALGRRALPDVQSLYTHPDAGVRFEAARTGARLGDPQALTVLADIALDRRDPARLLAIRELARGNSSAVAARLVELLSDPDREMRIGAYETLLQQRHPAVRSMVFGHILDSQQINCVLDIVDCPGPPLIYVRRTRLPRIAVFGSQTPVLNPVFYSGDEGRVTLVSDDGADVVRVFAKRGGHLSEEIEAAPRAVEVITALAALPQRDALGHLRGIGVPYSELVRVVSALCENGTIPAPLYVEQTSLTELFGPDDLPGRPETDADVDEDTSPSPSDTSAAPADAPAPAARQEHE